MAVRHGGKETIFDWSSKSPGSLQWAAFFSDCGHEVLEVTQGHRVTLTYNLFWCDGGPSHMATKPSALDPNSLHFYTALEKLYRCPSFLQKGELNLPLSLQHSADYEGGRIGFACTHGYPHTSGTAIKALANSLKGLDMTVFQALERINGDVHVQAALNVEKWYDELAEENEAHNDSDIMTTSCAEHLTEGVYLSPELEPVISGGEAQDDQEMNPESLTCYRQEPGAHSYSIEEVPYFPWTDVVWLNGQPQSFEEVAAFYIAVSACSTTLGVRNLWR